jgi:hypothetical protein
MFAGMGLSLLGTVVQMAGQSAQYGAQANAAAYQAQVARNNEKIAKQNASFTVLAGLDEQYKKGLETRALMGAQKTAQAANTIDVTSGSAKAVRDSTYLLGRMDEMTIMRNATRKADQYMAQAMNYAAEAGLYDYQAETAETAKNFALMSTLIGGATSFADKWKSWQAVGGTGVV